MDKLTFESFVNSEEYQTGFANKAVTFAFESFVNSEEYQTEFTAEEIQQLV